MALPYLCNGREKRQCNGLLTLKEIGRLNAWSSCVLCHAIYTVLQCSSHHCYDAYIFRPKHNSSFAKQHAGDKTVKNLHIDDIFNRIYRRIIWYASQACKWRRQERGLMVDGWGFLVQHKYSHIARIQQDCRIRRNTTEHTVL